MSNIFKDNQNIKNKPKRNNFDLSFQNHLTMKFGTLYPVFCKEVLPGDSFRIESAFGLKFMPLVFPVQSGMRATMHFFYCRNKNLWKNWENWISNLEEHTHPFIDQSPDFFKTGSLADYLDIPTTLISSSLHRVVADTSKSLLTDFSNSDSDVSEFCNTPILTPIYGGFPTALPSNLPVPVSYDSFPSFFQDDNEFFNFRRCKFAFINSPLRGRLSSDSKFYVSGSNLPSTIHLSFWHSQTDLEHSILIDGVNSSPNFSNLVVCDVSSLPNGNYVLTPQTSSGFSFNFDVINHFLSTENVYVAVGSSYFFNSSSSTINLFHQLFVNGQVGVGKTTIYFGSYFAYDSFVTLPVDVSETGSAPFGAGSDRIHLNALPFRAYESIYQAFYRNTRNQEFIVDGQPVYNRYNTTTEDGADSTDYHLYQRNYELDFLTSALRSPQQGNAPLVGMSALGNITIEDEDGITTAQAQLADDNETIIGVNVTSPIAGRAHALTLQEIASAGFSINDFRQTNALTRWVEMNLRAGYRYIDFVPAHHGVKPKYNELDMPEFIGGYSRDVQVNSILNQTASPDADPLGSFAGTANCFGGSKHSITHFCDDYGWIIGILCVTPQPAYSQLLPKHYLKSSPLDYYFPEFAQLGMQPVTYEEVCPVQAWSEYLADNTKKLQDTFGYQRPNYDLVAYTDQVHGNFRTDLRNFLINRVFANRPELGDDFLMINPDEVNDIFQVTTPNNDVIAGQVVFRVHAKRAIPRIHMPSLGR